jgi:hypothetical protein
MNLKAILLQLLTFFRAKLARFFARAGAARALWRARADAVWPRLHVIVLSGWDDGRRGSAARAVKTVLICERLRVF